MTSNTPNSNAASSNMQTNTFLSQMSTDTRDSRRHVDVESILEDLRWNSSQNVNTGSNSIPNVPSISTPSIPSTNRPNAYSEHTQSSSNIFRSSSNLNSGTASDVNGRTNQNLQSFLNNTELEQSINVDNLPELIPLDEPWFGRSGRHGIPDVLLPPEPLTSEEIKVLDSHTRDAVAKRLDLLWRMQKHLASVASVLTESLGETDLNMNNPNLINRMHHNDQHNPRHRSDDQPANIQPIVNDEHVSPSQDFNTTSQNTTVNTFGDTSRRLDSTPTTISEPTLPRNPWAQGAFDKFNKGTDNSMQKNDQDN
ncbi:hypothetical protein K502DRAFT_324385, partial [Neoconidiobolus thromboides FSU 785]